MKQSIRVLSVAALIVFAAIRAAGGAERLELRVDGMV